MRQLTCGTIAVAIVGASLAGQQPAVVRLTQPDLEHAESFTRVSGLRELSDGRVVVVDASAREIRISDMKAGTSQRIGRVGSGPGEYQFPAGVFALGSDSSAITELHNDVVHVLSPKGILVRSFSARLPGALGRTPRVLFDTSGRIYAEAPPVRGPAATAPVALWRWDTTSPKADTVAYLSPRVTPAGMVLRRPVRTRAFQVIEEWVVAADGWLAIASAAPFRLTFVEGDGTRHVGPEIPYERVPVTDRHKKEWIEEHSRPQVVAARTRSGGTSYEMRKPPPPTAVEWPDYLPPFLNGAVWSAPNGAVWVHRTTASESQYDVVDRTGRVTQQVVLREGARVVGFGRAAVYVVRVDDDGLEFLQRYALP